MHDDPDFELVRAMAGGDSQALETLYERHGSALLLYLTGVLGERARAEEVLQDVLLAAWKGAPRFRGESQVRTWLFGIARYRAINARRRRTLPRSELNPHLIADEPRLPERVEQQERVDAVREAMSALPEEQRETLELLFFHELSGPEAARVMGVPTGTVKSRLHRAKSALQAWLNGEES